MSTKIKLFKILSECNEYGVGRFVNVSEFEGEYNSLKFGNGVSWCRMDGNFANDYRIIIVKGNGNIRYSWNVKVGEKENISKFVEEIKSKGKFKEKKGNAVKFIKMCGVKERYEKKQIRRDIKLHFKGNSCVCCGSCMKTKIDQKNGHSLSLSLSTQKIEHFQVLCNHCYMQKQIVLKKEKEIGKRYRTTQIPMLKSFGVDFTKGDETLDLKDPDCCVGTFWNDPVDFMEKLKLNVK
jgi:hypothetical protein